MERYQQSLSELNRLIEQNPEDAKAVAHRGEIYRLMEDFAAALADFNRAIELNSNYVWAIAHRGEIYHQKGCYQQALKDFTKAIKLEPNYVWAIAHRGESFYQLRHYQQAWKDFNQAVELKPDYAWAIMYRCQIYGLMNRYEEALVDFDRAIALDENIMPSWAGERGLLLSYLGQYAEAISCCEQGLEKNAKDYITLYTLAVVKARWKGLAAAKTEIDKTRAILQQATVNLKERAGILYRLGGLAALEGYSDEALSFLKEAILLDNEPFNLAHRDLAWLDLRNHPHFQALLSVKFIN